ncbi:MAG: holin [Clostridia bacterium]|nr:holin [Clostridia bacterium]MBO7319164.1 holin [Clostridia bacterium]
MDFDFTVIIECVIALLSAAVTTFLIPYLKQRLTEEKQRKLLFWVQTAVKAAEQIYGSKTGQKKKEYVVGFLLSKGIVFDVDEVTALVESEVYKLTEAAVNAE